MSKKLIIAGVVALIATYAGLRQPDGQTSHSATGTMADTAARSTHSGSASRAERTETAGYGSVARGAGGESERGSAAGSPATTIDRLTAESRVANYIQQHQRLPDYYIRKSAARRQGWDPAKGNLCQVLPGRAIGGDRFSNREGGLPEKSGRSWYEADVNYQCGRRGADRLLYSSDGLIFVTRDHYRHFEQVK